MEHGGLPIAVHEQFCFASCRDLAFYATKWDIILEGEESDAIAVNPSLLWPVDCRRAAGVDSPSAGWSDARQKKRWRTLLKPDPLAVAAGE